MGWLEGIIGGWSRVRILEKAPPLERCVRKQDAPEIMKHWKVENRRAALRSL